MTRRRDYLVSQGFTEQQADAIVLVCDLADSRTEPTQTIDAGAPAIREEIEVFVPTGDSVDPNFGGNAEIAPDVRMWNSRGFVWEDTGYEPSIGTSASRCKPKRAFMELQRVEHFILNMNGEVKNYNVYHEIADLRAICPYSDQQNPEMWATWGTASNGSHAPVTIDGKHYRSNLYGEAGDRLDASLWAQYISTPDTGQTSIVRMLTVEEFIAIQQAAAGP